jgi:hypothetical protein
MSTCAASAELLQGAIVLMGIESAAALRVITADYKGGTFACTRQALEEGG